MVSPANNEALSLFEQRGGGVITFPPRPLFPRVFLVPSLFSLMYPDLRLRLHNLSLFFCLNIRASYNESMTQSFVYDSQRGINYTRVRSERRYFSIAL